METAEGTKQSGTSSKGRQKWNLFQRGIKSKSGSSLSNLAFNDPTELQRVSFATSIDELPERPTAFQQVLRQIDAIKTNQGARFKKMNNFKKSSKDNRGSSPQAQRFVGSASSSNSALLDVSVAVGGISRPRSSSQSSATDFVTDKKVLVSMSGSEDLNSNSEQSRSLPTDTQATQSAGSILETIVQPTPATQLGASYPDGIGGSICDGVGGSPAGTKQQLELLKQKIIKTSEAIKKEQSMRDENVTDYLKLTTNADKQQAARIKIVFEKKNQKSSSIISQLQKKLDTYHRRLREIEANGSGKSGRFGGVVGSVKGGLSGLQQATQTAAGAIVSKPKDFAFKIKNRFGSVDNLTSLKNEDEDGEGYPVRYGSADDVSSPSFQLDSSQDFGADAIQDDSSNIGHLSTSDSPNRVELDRRVDAEQLEAIASDLLTLKSEIQECRKNQNNVERDWEKWKAEVQGKRDVLSNSLHEEIFRCERIEIQLSDLTGLHQQEVARLRQELVSMEEKVEYHARERARDLQEAIENCQTRVAKMELQQQQLVSVEGLENASARALFGKLINLLLSVMAVLLVLVSTVSGLLMPFMRSQGRILTTLVVVSAFIITYTNWDVILSWLSVLSS